MSNPASPNQSRNLKVKNDDIKQEKPKKENSFKETKGLVDGISTTFEKNQNNENKQCIESGKQDKKKIEILKKDNSKIGLVENQNEFSQEYSASIGNNPNNEERTDLDKQNKEKNEEENKKRLSITIPKEKVFNSQSTTIKKNDKKMKKEDKHMSSRENEQKYLFDFKNVTPFSFKENEKKDILPIPDCLNKKRKREIKEVKSQLNIPQDLGCSFGESFNLFKNEDDSRYKYKGFTETIKNPQIIQKYKKMGNSQCLPKLFKKDYNKYYENLDHLINLSELIQSENDINLFLINISYSSEEILGFNAIANISSNHDRNVRIYTQNLIINNYHSSSLYDTNDTTI